VLRERVERNEISYFFQWLADVVYWGGRRGKKRGRCEGVGRRKGPGRSLRSCAFPFPNFLIFFKKCRVTM